ncbi:restriction endonuclease fold toxin [Streptomyces sp. NPDC102467]|uniref:restriction endonuclease fold toxin n=1 Tax=Streptomyces sp. NPDC102467 TaxID=3366179 RepID=UPI00382C7D9E
MANDPWGTGKQMLDSFMKEPGEGLRALVPDGALPIATGGAGAWVKGARLAEGSGRRCERGAACRRTGRRRGGGGTVRRRRTGSGSAAELQVVDDYVVQTKPEGMQMGSAFRNQTKATFERATESGRIPNFHFEGQPTPEVLNKIRDRGRRYGIEPAIDISPL